MLACTEKPEQAKKITLVVLCALVERLKIIYENRIINSESKKSIGSNMWNRMLMRNLIIGICVLALLIIVGIIFITQIGITPTDTKIIQVLHENEENLLSIDGVVGARIARDESNHIIGIAIYVEDNTVEDQKIPSKLEEFEVFIKNVSEASEFEKERMIIHRIYPNDIIDTIFDDSEKINNTAAFLIRSHDPLTEEQIQILRNSGVRVLQTSEIPTVYHSLIEENNVEEIEDLEFIKNVYSYKPR